MREVSCGEEQVTTVWFQGSLSEENFALLRLRSSQRVCEMKGFRSKDWVEPQPASVTTGDCVEKHVESMSGVMVRNT